MTDWKEADIFINGHKLSFAQSMAIRVAATSFLGEMTSIGLGEDETGKAIAKGYSDRLREVVILMHEGSE